ncbi:MULTISPECIES: hypothetical protein [unclassified Embleya]|uniref:UGSC family (seleno)protein n=1 Tax=unclassified Embleya TaxID=2699296 RepID=UPI0033F44A0C
MTVHLLDPSGRVGEPAKQLAPGLPVLTGARIAVLDNLKPHAGYIQGAVARLLAERTGAVVTLEIPKFSAARPAEPEVLDRLRESADLIITGSADCGSCTSWSCHDTVVLEQAGIPTLLLATAGFTEIARQVSSLYGMPQARVLTVRGPLGGSSDNELDAMALEALEDALVLATTTPSAPDAA